jgi:hypothetical protein
VAGVTDRYTPNRIAYLLPLLDDQRLRPEFVDHRDPFVRRYRYCDTAVARLSSILNLKLYDENYPIPKAWERARTLARAWFQQNPERARLGRVQPPLDHLRIARDQRGRQPD